MTIRNGLSHRDAPEFATIEPSVPARDGGHWPVTKPLLGLLGAVLLAALAMFLHG